MDVYYFKLLMDVYDFKKQTSIEEKRHASHYEKDSDSSLIYHISKIGGSSH